MRRIRGYDLIPRGSDKGILPLPCSIFDALSRASNRSEHSSQGLGSFVKVACGQVKFEPGSQSAKGENYAHYWDVDRWADRWSAGATDPSRQGSDEFLDDHTAWHHRVVCRRVYWKRFVAQRGHLVLPFRRNYSLGTRRH